MILSCGESLIDMLPRLTKANEQAFAPYAGGALFNTAIALGRLGVETGFVSGLSTDLFGELLTEKLAESHVSTDLSIRSDRPTTLAFVRLVDGQASYTFYDENSALRLLTPANVPAIPDNVNAMIFGCISLVGEPCAQFYEALMQANAADRVIMIDPNIRPGFIQDDTSYRARLDRMIALSDVVKLSDEDLHWLRGDGDSADLANALLAQGPRIVCITEGAKGVTAYTAAGSFFVPATQVDVVDTVGAGDTFNAGFLAALDQAGRLTKAAIADLDEATLRAAIGQGARAAAVTVSRAGANPPWAHEMA